VTSLAYPLSECSIESTNLTDGLPFTAETVHIFHSNYFDYKGAFQAAVDSAA